MRGAKPTFRPTRTDPFWRVCDTIAPLSSERARSERGHDRPADRAAGIEAVQAISRMGRPAGPITDGAGASQASAASLDQRFADPRNNPLNPKFDRAFAEETQRMAQALYKDPPAA